MFCFYSYCSGSKYSTSYFFSTIAIRISETCSNSICCHLLCLYDARLGGILQIISIILDSESGGADDIRAAADNNSCKLYLLYSVSLILAAIWSAVRPYSRSTSAALPD